MASSSALSSYAIFIIVIIFISARVVRRTIANNRGTRFSLERTYIFAGVYIALGVVFSALSFLEGVPILLSIPEVILGIVAAFGSYRYTDRRISFWKPADASLYFRGGVVVYLIYLVGLITRLLIDAVLIGPSSFDPASSVQLNGAGLYGAIVADFLLIFGVGLLIGRSLRVERRYRRILRGEESVPSTPPTHLGSIGSKV